MMQQLWFTKPFTVEVREQELPEPAAGELLVQTLCSGISAGTEMLVYRGQIPGSMALDARLDSLSGEANYPLQYFVATPATVITVPEDIESEAAVFRANMETAVNLVQDGAPALGERVVVLGQGIVGLLLTSLLARFPLADLAAVDGVVARRAQALQSGARQAIDPSTAPTELASSVGADLIYEVSGIPEALNLAVSLSGYHSRIVIGSWYGNKSALVPLGGEAHRNRLQISTSQVSTIAPQLSGRWDKARRFELSWEMIRQVQPQQMITHRAPLQEADVLYKLLHEAPGEVLQALFIF